MPFGAGSPASMISQSAVTGQPFTNALLVNTFNRPLGSGDCGLNAQILTPVHKGDVLWISFRARCLESKRETGEAFVEVRFDQLVAGKYVWPPYLERGVSIGHEWTQTSIPFVMNKDVSPSDVRFVIKFDTYPQRFEISSVTFINCGADVNLADLPRTIIHYGGDAPAAPWRKAAADRIEKYRKGDLSIEVVNAAGKPLPGAEVNVVMKRIAFNWGTATSSQRLLDSSNDSKIYRDTLLKYFNQVVLENEIKSKNWARFNYNQTSKGIAWLNEHQIPIRGHVMVWPSWQNSGPEIGKLKDDTSALRGVILKIISEQTSVMKGWFTEWDVVNEPFAHDDFLKLLGRRVMLDWYAAARKGAPATKLFLNDYTMFHGEGPGSASERFYDNVKYLIDNGAPINAIGEQGHIGGTPPPIPKVLERLDYFSKLGLPIQISEFDINSNDDDFKARYLADFMTAIFSNPSTIGFVQWGFWEGQHWFPVAALWDKNWKPRANGKAFTELVSKQWNTRAEGKTRKDGKYSLRGFNGDYEVRVKYDGKEATHKVVLTSKGATLRIKMTN